MRPGERWRGADGTEYLVVNPQEVRHNQPRWWVAEIPPEEGDTTSGPKTHKSLHTLPISLFQKFGSVTMALVLDN